jgi:hypothetical protein
MTLSLPLMEPDITKTLSKNGLLNCNLNEVLRSPHSACHTFYTPSNYNHTDNLYRIIGFEINC